MEISHSQTYALHRFSSNAITGEATWRRFEHCPGPRVCGGSGVDSASRARLCALKLGHIESVSAGAALSGYGEAFFQQGNVQEPHTLTMAKAGACSGRGALAHGSRALRRTDSPAFREGTVRKRERVVPEKWAEALHLAAAAGHAALCRVLLELGPRHSL